MVPDRPPPPEHLATIACACGATLSEFEWPLDAAVAGPGAAIRVGVPVRRSVCPECDLPLPHPT